jgi:tRNA U34 2-thiouridine synthase MnmA/TrmU
MVKGLVLFSGGLDSVIAAHLLKSQGISLKALHFVLPFYSGFGFSYKNIKEYAQALEIPLRIEEEGEEFLSMVKNPKFGFGKNANPCIDCRILRLEKAFKIMAEEGASFIATGEVVGQRPMSQRMDCLHKIEKSANLEGILVRPLSARLFSPTKLEIEGLIDREKLLDISGKSRKRQLEYAKKHNLIHSTPAGGCILTNIHTANRIHEMLSKSKTVSLFDFKLMAYGRHFRINGYKLVVSRDESENNILEKFRNEKTCFFQISDIPGPFGITDSIIDTDIKKLAASIVARYSKVRNENSVNVKIICKGKEEEITVKPANSEFCDKSRI